MRRCLSFLILLKIKDNLSVLLKKNVSDGKEMTENINDKSETEFASDEDPLNMHRIELHQIRQLLFLRFQI